MALELIEAFHDPARLIGPMRLRPDQPRGRPADPRPAPRLPRPLAHLVAPPPRGRRRRPQPCLGFRLARPCRPPPVRPYTQYPQGEEFHWYSCRFGSDGSFSHHDICRVRLHPTFDATLAAGTSYTFDHQALHRVIPLGDTVAATLVVTGRFLRDGSDIYTEESRDLQGARLPRTPLGPTTLLARLHQLQAEGF